jgi:triosephosphate isomerase
LRLPLIIINFKNYPEIYGQKTIELSKAAQKVADDTNVEIVLAPPQASIAVVSQCVPNPVLCQHLDDAPEGASTGLFIPEMAKSFGASGSLLNHSEHRLEGYTISKLTERLRSLQLTSVVCAKTPDEVANIAKLRPDFIAIEPPELIRCRNKRKNRRQQRSSTRCRGYYGRKCHRKITLLDREATRLGLRI